MAKEPVFRVKTPHQIRVLMAPVRMEIVEALMALGASSARRLAEYLGRVPESLYYHLKLLRGIGIVGKKEKRRRGGRNEAVYVLVARLIELDHTNTSRHFRQAWAKATGTLLRLTERQMTQAVLTTTPDSGPRTIRIGRENVRLTRRGLAELNKRLDDLHRFLSNVDDATGEVRIGLTLAMYPIDDKT